MKIYGYIIIYIVNSDRYLYRHVGINMHNIYRKMYIDDDDNVYVFKIFGIYNVRQDEYFQKPFLRQYN